MAHKQRTPVFVGIETKPGCTVCDIYTHQYDKSGLEHQQYADGTTAHPNRLTLELQAIASVIASLADDSDISISSVLQETLVALSTRGEVLPESEQQDRQYRALRRIRVLLKGRHRIHSYRNSKPKKAFREWDGKTSTFRPKIPS